MTEVAFHTGIPDKLDYACRLLRKAWRTGARVVVTGSADELASLDQALWVFEQAEFVPHLRLGRGEAVPQRMKRTPIWLVEDTAVDLDASVMVNLGPDFAEHFDRFDRVIELVSTAESDVQSGRHRWRRFIETGVAPANRPFGRPAA